MYCDDCLLRFVRWEFLVSVLKVFGWSGSVEEGRFRPQHRSTLVPCQQPKEDYAFPAIAWNMSSIVLSGPVNVGILRKWSFEKSRDIIFSTRQFPTIGKRPHQWRSVESVFRLILIRSNTTACATSRSQSPPAPSQTFPCCRMSPIYHKNQSTPIGLDTKKTIGNLEAILCLH